MIARRLRIVYVLAGLAGLVVGCGSAAPPTTVRSASATSVPAPTPTQTPTETSSATPAPTAAEKKPCGADVVLGLSQAMLSPGTYAWLRPRPGVRFPVICFKVSGGWESNERFMSRARPGEDGTQVAMMFWDVGQVYGHPCDWQGTLFNPGPTVDDLADALADIPLRNASEPVDVTLGGYSGKYLEWSVPRDIEVDEQGDFTTCDTDGGTNYFESWTGDPAGWGGDRYHQGPGQLDRLWILDVDGVRFVIDAFSMPTATEAEVEDLLQVVSSITFEY